MDFSVDGCCMHNLTVLTVPAFDDNYLWLIHNGKNAIVVDPGDAAPIRAALAQNGLSLVAILLTHHHGDHIGGVQSLLADHAIPVYGPKNEAIAGVTRHLSEGDTIDIAELPLTLSILDVPGHTRGHIAYVATEQKWLFCGDTLFAGGCGRLFEGTPQQMCESLSKLTALPDDTKVFCAHEYTMSNLRFACEVDPDNTDLRDRFAVEKAKRDVNQPTVPSSIGLEKATNPFLRYGETAIINRLVEEGRLAGKDTIAAFAALREWKNNYR